MAMHGTIDPREKLEADETLNVNDDQNKSVTNTNDLYELEEEEEEELYEEEEEEEGAVDDLDKDDI